MFIVSLIVNNHITHIKDILIIDIFYRRRVTTKHAFGVSDPVRHRRGCTNKEHDKRLKIAVLGSMENVIIYATKTKAIISNKVTVQLI